MTEIFQLPDSFSDYDHAMHVLNYELPGMPSDLHAGTYGLKRVFDLLTDLGSPQDDLKVIHIAGTSGKGSASYMIDALLRDKGVKTGLSVSPYVYDMKERWYVDGQFLEDHVILDAASMLLPALHKASSAERLTSRFETIICLMFILMRQNQVDYLVMETGMGGLLDPTNTVTAASKIAVLTNIGLDHTKILGSTIREVSKQKAGIIKPSNKVFSYAQDITAMEVFDNAAESNDTEVVWVDPFTGQEDNTKPMFAKNAALAYAVAGEALQRIGLAAHTKDQSAIILENLNIPGRGERVMTEFGMFIFDGAHNKQKMTAMSQAMGRGVSRSELGVITIIAREQQQESLIEILSELSDEIYVLDYPEGVSGFKSALAPVEVQKIATGMGIAVKPIKYSEIQEVIGKSSKREWLVTGSFYHLAVIKKIVT